MENSIEVTALAEMLGSSLTSAQKIIVFTADGNTQQVVFDDAVAQANTNNGCLCVNFSSVEVSSAEILALTTPVLLAPAVAANEYIDIMSVVCEYTHGGTNYSGGGNMLIGSSSGPQFYFNGTLQATGDRYVKAIPSVPTGADSNIALSDGIYLYTLVNPTLGDGTMRFDVTYVVKSI